MNYCIDCKHYHYNTSKKEFECSSGIMRIFEVPCDSYVEDTDMVWGKVPRSHGRLIDADALDAKIKRLAIADYPFDALGCCGVVLTAPTVLEASE